MSLVPESLEEMESRIFSSETDGIGSIGTENDLLAFCQSGKRDIGHVKFLECAPRGTELTLSAVDDEKIWDGPFLIHPPPKISGNDFCHRTVVVIPPLSLDAHMPVLALLRGAIFEYDRASHGLGSLMMAYVDTHDEAGDDLQIEPIP